MKKGWIYALALACAACGGDDSAEEPAWSGDNYVIAFSLGTADGRYDAAIADGRIVVRIPYNVSIDGARAVVTLSENASIRPDPSTIADWSQEWQFLVTSYGQRDRTYLYTVERTDIASEGSLTLRTQADVDAFAASGINAVEGNLTVGTPGGEAITDLDGLSALTSVRCDLTITDAYRGEDLAGLANLTHCESFVVGSADAPHPTIRRVSLPALQRVGGDLLLEGPSIETVDFTALQQVAGDVRIGSDALVQLTADELESVGGAMRLAGTSTGRQTAPCQQMFFPKLNRVDGELCVTQFDHLAQLATTFDALTAAGGIRYEKLGTTATCEFPLVEAAGGIVLDDCPALRAISLPKLAQAQSIAIAGCPAVASFEFPHLERLAGDLSLTTLPAVESLDALFPQLSRIEGSLTLDDLAGLAGELDLSRYAFSDDSTFSLRFITTPRLTDVRGGSFAGSLTLDASSWTAQPETLPFRLTGFETLQDIRIVGLARTGELSLPTKTCRNLTVENCGSRVPFTLSLPALTEVREILLCRNCGQAGAENKASFPCLRRIGRQLAFYANASAFTTIEFPELETVGDGSSVSDDPASDYAFYTMPSGCSQEFSLPKLQRVEGNMLLSTWSTATDRVEALRFPALQSIAGSLVVGHASYRNRTVVELDFPALREAGSVYIGNLSALCDFSTFVGVLPSLSQTAWQVEQCGYDPTYEQMLDGLTVQP